VGIVTFVAYGIALDTILFLIMIVSASAESQKPTKQIIITEVELSFVNGTQWIEVYNPTHHEISLATTHIDGSEGHQLQILGGLSGILPQHYERVGLHWTNDTGYPIWSNTNNSILVSK